MAEKNIRYSKFFYPQTDSKKIQNKVFNLVISKDLFIFANYFH